MPLGRGDLAHVVKEHERRHPLLVGDVVLPREVVEVVDEPVEELFEPAARLGLEAVLDRLRDGELVDVPHRRPPPARRFPATFDLTGR